MSRSRSHRTAVGVIALVAAVALVLASVQGSLRAPGRGYRF